jgi:hypothetical protein
VQTFASTGGAAAPPGDQSKTDQARDKAQEAGEAAKQQAQQAAGQAKGAVRTQVDQRSTQAGEQIGSVAGDVRSFGSQLREQGKDKPAQYAEQAADRVERLGGYLRDNDADRILGDVEDFGRRQPWAVVAGGLALGFAASRFLKASSSRRYEQRGQSQLPRTTSASSYTTPGTGGYTTPGTGTGAAAYEPPGTTVSPGGETPLATGVPGGIERTP